MTSTAPETFVTTTKVAADPNAVAAPLPMATAKYRLPPLHPEGRKFVAIAVAITLFFGFVLDYAVAGWLMAGVTGWVAAFFRDPERTTPQGEGLMVSPADGMVCMVGDVEVPRQLAGEGGLTAERVRRVSIFMNVFDVHINRTPITGTVSRVVYVPGKFLNADLDKASEDNERQYFIVDSADGVRVGFTQIAGLVARRIMRFVQTGDTVVAGQRIGLIRFGSRVDVYLPDGYGCQVLAGQRCVAGETVLARLGHSDVAAGVTQ